MAQRKSAKKELAKNLKRNQRNLAVESQVKKTIKQFRKAVQEKNSDSAKEILPRLYEILDKASSKRIIHPNKAGRKKSRLTKLLKKSA